VESFPAISARSDSSQPSVPPIHIPAAPHRRQATSLPPPSRAGMRACGRGHRRSPLDRNAGDERASGPPGGLPSSALPIQIPTAAITASPHPCRPLTSGPAGMRTRPQAIPLDRNAGDPRPRPSGRRALIRAAKLNPYRRHHRQAASLPPPHERASGPAGGGGGDPRSTGMQATSDPGPLAGCLLSALPI
jgi:hypothetical protein